MSAVLVNACGWPNPHVPHTYDVINPAALTVVTTLVCTGKDTP